MNDRWRVALTLVLTWTCVSTAMGNEGPCAGCPRTGVYVFRGFVGYWPDAFGMAARMSKRGYRPQVYRSREVPQLTLDLLKAQAQGSRGPVLMIGYSYGASAAVTMATDLMEHGITVDRMVLIECYDHPEIPANVRYCVNIYETRRLDRVQPFRGTPARAADPSSTLLIDIDIARAPEWEAVRENNHFNMADDPRVQDFVAQQFPDLMPRIPDAAGYARGIQTIALPRNRDLAVAAPTLPGLNPAVGSLESSYGATHPELPGVTRDELSASYQVLRNNEPLQISPNPRSQGLGVPQFPNLTQRVSRDLTVVDPQSMTYPPARPSAVTAPTPQVWSPTYRYQNPLQRTTHPEPPVVQRSSPYSSYRVRVAR